MWDDSVKYDSCLEEELFFFLLTKGFNQQVVEVVLNSLATALPVLQPLCLHILSSKGGKSLLTSNAGLYTLLFFSIMHIF